MNDGSTWRVPLPRNSFERRLGIDVRALAALRLALGVLLLGDLVMRVRDLEAFYTDAGVLPTDTLADLYPVLETLSIHAWSGSLRAQVVLVAIAAVAAVALLVGYRTRLAATCSWLLLVSLYARNPYVVNGGDTILVATFFVCLFLPLGARWSLDAVRTPADVERSHITTPAAVTLLCLVVLIYGSNALLRFQSEWWMSGDAVRLVFSLDQYTVFLGPTLAQFDPLLVAINYTWMVLLSVSILLPVLTGWRRALFVLPYIGAHLGMLATMRLGLFPLVMVAVLLPFFPSFVWDRVERVVAEPLAKRITRLTARVGISPAGRLDGRSWPAWRWIHSERVGRWRRRTAAVAVALVLVGATGWQAAVVADVAVQVGNDEGLDTTEHGWAMFSPAPPEADEWYVVPGELESGERVDAFHGGTVSWDRPPNVAATYPSALWHRYLTNLRTESDRVQAEFGTYLCTQRSDRFGGALVEVEGYYVREMVSFEGQTEPERVHVFSVNCSARQHRAGS